ncbi:hypothetical protein D9757_014327 [Collybiopsis confluens]|uniref:BTB domain-containing protein n=1 Tax=Collybiopsis confluens TaxID=2823264 RepID=A0A8H5CJG5_9AGAR|nr:hypothetical protein D9757_014327 [Collybiopsis confluens]
MVYTLQTMSDSGSLNDYSTIPARAPRPSATTPPPPTMVLRPVPFSFSKAASPSISADIDEVTLSTGRSVKINSAFYFDFVVFQVEQVLYRLPRHRFTEESSVFADMFALPQGAERLTEGSDNDNPIRLEQTQRKDWDCLLKLLFHRQAALPVLHPGLPEPNFGFDEWVSVLSLATRWEMNFIRETAIERIARFTNSAKKIAVARQYQVYRIILPSLVVLVGRTEPLSASEAADLGLECAMKIFSIRERCQDNSQGYNGFRQRKLALDTSTPNSGNWNSIVIEIQNVFVDHDEYYK